MRVDPKKVEKALLKSKLDWSTFTKRAGISPVTWWYIKNGKIRKNHLKVIYKISKVLNVEPEEILEDEECQK